MNHPLNPSGPTDPITPPGAPVPEQVPTPAAAPIPQGAPPSSGVGKARNTLALVALVVAVLGTVFALIHGAMIVGWILLPIAFVLSIVALVQHGKPKGVAVAALVVSIVGTIIGVVAFMGAVGDAVDDAFNTPVSGAAQSEEDTTGESAAAPQETAEADDSPQAVTPQPFSASELLGGNATPDFPDGEAGKVSVVQVGSMLKDKGILLFAFRNNTDAAISRVDWSATARSGGSIVGSGSSQGTTPSQVRPGEVGLAYIYFDSAATIPDDADYDFQVTTSPADTSFFNTAALKVTEANVSGDAIVGGASNATDASATGPFSVDVYCFDGDKLIDQAIGFSDQDAAAPGDSVSFSVALYGQQCSTFALGVSGYFQ